MAAPKELTRGDACPSCSGELRAAIVPSDDQLRKATDRENPQSLPYGADTATLEQRAELGELFVCDRCGYRTRFEVEPDADADADDAAPGSSDAATSRPAAKKKAREKTPA